MGGGEKAWKQGAAITQGWESWAVHLAQRGMNSVPGSHSKGPQHSASLPAFSTGLRTQRGSCSQGGPQGLGQASNTQAEKEKEVSQGR